MLQSIIYYYDILLWPALELTEKDKIFNRLRNINSFNLQKEWWQWVTVDLFFIMFNMFIMLVPRLGKICTGNQSVKYTHLDLKSSVHWKSSDLSLSEIQMTISKQDK